MATFHIPGPILQSVGILGASAPDSGYYAATIENVEKHPTRGQTRKVTLNFEGFSTSDWLTIPFNERGDILAQYADRDNDGNAVLNKKGRGCIAAFKTMLVSAGYTDAQMVDGATDDWLVGKSVAIEWHAGADIGAQYGEVVGYLTPKTFSANMAAGKKPSVAGAGQVVAGGNATNITATAPMTVAVAPAPSTSLPPAPSNGATAATAAAPSMGGALPPAPNAASIVN